MNINATLIGQSIAFFVFVWFVMKYVWPPLLNVLNERKKTIADGLAAAERGKHQQEIAEKHAAEVIHEAKQQAAELHAAADARRRWYSPAVSIAAQAVHGAAYLGEQGEEEQAEHVVAASPWQGIPPAAERITSVARNRDR